MNPTAGMARVAGVDLKALADDAAHDTVAGPRGIGGRADNRDRFYLFQDDPQIGIVVLIMVHGPLRLYRCVSAEEAELTVGARTAFDDLERWVTQTTISSVACCEVP